MEVVGEAADGQAAVEQALSLRPDVVVMDVNMPKVNGVEATRKRITGQ
jgi:two-component system, chemotaxis family, protein-glutamate methylesterase/glutaminase